MPYYVYMIKTIGSSYSKSYVGYTNDIKRRIIKHNANKGAKSTRGYKWKLIYHRKFVTKSAAMSYEYRLKKNYYLRNKIKKSNLNEKN